MTKLSRYPEQVRFSSSLPLSWFAQLCSERRVVRRVGGRPVRRFERIKNDPAEALDATIYAFAARYSMRSVDFDAREQRLSQAVEPVARTRPTGRRVAMAQDPYL